MLFADVNVAVRSAASSVTWQCLLPAQNGGPEGRLTGIVWVSGRDETPNKDNRPTSDSVRWHARADQLAKRRVS